MVDPADLDELKQEQVGGDPAARRHVDWKARLQARLVAGDERGAWATVEAAMIAGLDPAGVYESMLVPAMNDIGELWESGHLDVAAEHRASAVATRLIGRLGPRFSRRGRTKGTVVIAAPSGDLHGLGLGVLADMLRGAGFDVADLGPNCPAESLRRACGEAANLVAAALSSHNSGGDPEVAAAVEAARAGGAPLVLLGGCAVDGEAHARRLGADAWAPTASEAVALLSGAAIPG